MKLEPVFKTENNELFLISDGSKPDLNSFEKITVSWAKVEIDDEVYNEEFLAQLRETLKSFEEQNKYAILVPEVDKNFETQVQKEAFISAMNHTARRVKDCKSVAGFELTSEILKDGLGEGKTAANFMETLAVKHAQYVYFAKSEDINALNLTEDISKSNVVVQ